MCTVHFPDGTTCEVQDGTKYIDRIAVDRPAITTDMQMLIHGNMTYRKVPHLITEPRPGFFYAVPL